MLLGQNVNAYGKGLSSGETFASLLRQINEIDGDFRVRFMTSHPKDASARHIAKHIHLPVQSGSDKILGAMNRKYTRDQYLARVLAFREAVPGIALTTDCIVGFPGETETDFQDTLSLIKTIRFDSAFTFIFSPREGTKAETLPERVEAKIARDRINRLIAAQESISGDILKSLIGSPQLVLVDDQSRRNADEISGKCERNITVNFTGDVSLVGKFVSVEVTEAKHNTLKAKRV
jgi:tRNA-2-methylthio-N6-dimethylallyladenosine synthase